MSLAPAENDRRHQGPKQGAHRRGPEGLSGEDRQAPRQASRHVRGRQARLRRQVQHQVDPRRDDDPRLRLCRIEGRGLGSDQGHDPHQPRPGRLRAIFLGLAPQLLHRHDRHRHLRDDAVHLRLPGKGHRLRRRQEARQDHGRDPGPVPAEQGHHRSVGMPDRPDRRRHRSGLQGEVEGIRRQDHRAGPLRRLPRRVAVARPSHRQRRRARLGVRQAGRQAGAVRADALRRGHHRRLQHRRRRLVFAHPARGDGPAGDRAMVGRRHHRRAGSDAQSQAQRAALLPLDELHLAPHGREVRYSVGRIQLLRADQDRGIAAQDRQPFRRQDQGRRRARHREISAR